MRSLLSAAVLAGFLLASVSRPAGGQLRLRLYSDSAFTQCTLSDAAPGVVNVYVAEEAFLSVAVRFRVVASPGFTGVWLSDATPYSFFGSSQTDLGIHFGGCKSGKFLIVTMAYQLFGTSTCGELAIAPPAGFTVPICFDCFDELPCLGSALHVNCPGPFDCDPVAIEPNTWGRVKALYRN